MSKVRVRFAPSPTGYLHIGSLRTALYNFLFAKKEKGDFLLRIEDTDQKRFVEGAEENLLNTLKWAGINWDNKEIIKQSGRLEIYKKYADQLVKEGKAYYCFCAPERLEEMRAEQTAQKKPPIYDRHCLNLSEEEIKKNLENKAPFVIRMKIPRGETLEFNDLIRGKVSFKTDLVDDQVIIKSDGFPTYHLASVVDDQEMEITHVIRGEEWLPSAPKHLLLYKYFGWEAPEFSHLPLLLNSDKSKLSKRQGDVAVEDYIKQGYLKEAIINFVALLGWNPGEGSTQEIFSLEELIQKFDLSHVHKAGAVFDVKKLDWMNSQWIKKINLDDLYSRALEFLEKKDFYINTSEEKKSEEYIKKFLTVERERLEKLSEVGESNKFFFQDINYDKELLRWKDMDDENIRKSLETAKMRIENLSTDFFEIEKSLDMPFGYNQTQIDSTLMMSIDDEKFKKENGKPDLGKILWPVRVALTGEQKSPSPTQCAWVLGQKESLKRIGQALKK